MRTRVRRSWTILALAVVPVLLAAGCGDDKKSGSAATGSNAATTPSATTATLVVADDGPGMSGETAGRVFDRFWQAEPTMRGTGLGLSIVSEILAAHGGAIDLATAPGEGARFTVTLPLDRPAFRGSSQEGAVAFPG